VAKRLCLQRAEWRLVPGKPALRLSEYYHLACDYGTAVALSWEKHGVAPIYLCEDHAAEAGFLAEDSTSEPLTRPALDTEPPEQPNSPALATPSMHLQNASEKDLQGVSENERVTIAGAPAVSPVHDRLVSNLSANSSADESAGSEACENFEAYGTVLRPASTAIEEQARDSESERLCVSRYGERCTYESTVHCPKCRKWFCDAHAEDGNWHCCVRRM